MKRYFFGILLILGLVCATGFFWVKLQISVESQVMGYQLRVNQIKLAQFLIQNGYYGGEGFWKTARVTVTGEKQPYMAIFKSAGEEPFQSATVRKDITGLTLTAYCGR